jgi:hypothetical protein
MPSATAVRRRRAPASEPIETTTAPVLDAVAVSEFVNEGIFDPFDEAVPFFQAIAMIREGEWERYLLYLYRLDPRVRNPEGEKAFIDKFQRCVDEGDIAVAHGGGKYMLILKDDVLNRPDPSAPQTRSRACKFRCEGAPKLQPGQSVVNNGGGTAVEGGVVLPPGPAPAASGDSSLAALTNILRDLIKDNNNQKRSADSDVTTKSFEAALELVKKQAATSTGSALGDKLLEMLLPLLLNRKSETDPILAQLAKATIDRMSNPAASEIKNPLGELTVVKELLGVGSLRELFELGAGGGGEGWKLKAFEAMGALAQNAPQIIGLFLSNQERAFQRQLQLENLRRHNAAIASGQTPPPLEATAIVQPPLNPMQNPPAGPVPISGPTGADQPGGAPMIMDPMSTALMDIVFCFGEGFPGDATARFLRTKFPQIVAQLQPFLAGDLDQVKMFCQNTPSLSEIAGDEEFPEFLTAFIGEVLHPEEPEPEEPAAA